MTPSVASAERRRLRGGGLAFVGHDFPVLAAKRMVVEQNADSMGIDHNPGGYRDLTWGERERGLWTIHAGWEDGVLVVYSRADDAKALERYSLPSANRLRVQVTIDSGSDEIDLIREFRRSRRR